MVQVILMFIGSLLFFLPACVCDCCLGQKSLVWTLKRVDSRWLWWRTMIRFVSCQPAHALHTQTSTAGRPLTLTLTAGPRAGAYVCVPAGQRQDLQAPVEVCGGEPRLLPAQATSRRQSQPQRLHPTRVALQIQVER